MMAFLSTIFSKVWGYILIALSVIAAALTIWFSAKKVGNAETQTKDDEAVAVREVNETNAAATTEVKAIENASDVKTDVSNLAPGSAASELQSNWQQPS